MIGAPARGTGTLVVGVLWLALALGSPASAGFGEVRGSIALAGAGARLADLGPTAVFLDRRDGRSDFVVSTARVAISQKEARFDPSFLVIAVGQTVEMPNRDLFFHNVFSYSQPNAFDLGTYPAGESRSVTFRHPGVVRVYCSIHESMRAVIVVAPSPWFAVVDAHGEFRIPSVPPGEYELRSFNEALPEVTRDLTVLAGQSSPRLNVQIEAR